MYIAGGGVVGTLARYAIATAVEARFGSGFPYHTLTVNGLGCFVAGLLFGVLERGHVMAGDVKLFWLTGVLGAFTTFSALIIETWRLQANGQAWSAFANVLFSVGVGFLALWFGSRLAATF